MTAKEYITDLLNKADIKVNWNRDFDIIVNDEQFYQRVLSGWSLALWETYMEKIWDCSRIDIFIEKLLRSGINENVNLYSLALALKSKLLNLQSLKGAKKVINTHYDLNNDLYMSFLDPYFQYSCGYFKDTDDLNIAQEKKLDLICRKLELKEWETVLDIWCGWWWFAKYAASKYGCKVTWITISQQQVNFAKEKLKDLPVSIVNLDYRHINQKFDKVVSIWMFEHVGYKNYKKFMKIVDSCLKDEWLFLLHTIWSNITSYRWDAWSNKYIFPNWMLPSISQIWKATEWIFIMEDWHNFGPYYNKTLLAWEKNFTTNWDSLKDMYSETFYRMFKYYFMIYAGAFKSRSAQLRQIVFSKWKSDTVYNSIR